MISSNERWANFLKARFLKDSKPVAYHVNSFIWPALRNCYAMVLENSTWLIGDGKTMNFWNDKWLEEPLVKLMNIPDSWQKSLLVVVKDFISNRCWNIPICLQTHFPNLFLLHS